MSVLADAGMPAYAAAPMGTYRLAPAPAQLCGGPNNGHGGNTFNFNKNITNNTTKNFDFSKKIIINKPVTINKSITISKPITINKNINIEKNIDASKTIIINKNIDASKNITINKNVNVDFSAEISAYASAQATAQAQAMSFVRGGGSSYVTVINSGGDLGQIAVTTQPEQTVCVRQVATVVKSIHAICIDTRGREHPAARMIPETWVDSSFDKELYRCLEGSTLKVTIGDVVQSSQGLVGLFESGAVLTCKRGEALRHYQDGLVKCAIAEKVPDCTERENMRRYGIGNLFFSYVENVCVPTQNISEAYFQSGASVSSASQGGEVEVSGNFNGGVGYAP